MLTIKPLPAPVAFGGLGCGQKFSLRSGTDVYIKVLESKVIDYNLTFNAVNIETGALYHIQNEDLVHVLD